MALYRTKKIIFIYKNYGHDSSLTELQKIMVLKHTHFKTFKR